MKRIWWIVLFVHTCDAYKHLSVSVEKSKEEKFYNFMESGEEISKIGDVKILNAEEMKGDNIQKVEISNLTVDYVPVILKQFPEVLALGMRYVGKVDLTKLILKQ